MAKPKTHKNDAKAILRLMARRDAMARKLAEIDQAIDASGRRLCNAHRITMLLRGPKLRALAELEIGQPTIRKQEDTNHGASISA